MGALQRLWVKIISYSVSDKAIGRTAPSTLGLFTRTHKFASFIPPSCLHLEEGEQCRSNYTFSPELEEKHPPEHWAATHPLPTLTYTTLTYTTRHYIYTVLNYTNYTNLHYTSLYLHCTKLHYTILYLHYTSLYIHYTKLHYTTLYLHYLA